MDHIAFGIIAGDTILLWITYKLLGWVRLMVRLGKEKERRATN